MTRKTKFVDAFWVSDFCGSTGYDNLQKHMKDGRDTCKEMDEIFKQRAKIEEDYSKNLMKLTKLSAVNSELKSLKSAWDTLKSHTEKIAHEHMDLANQFSERARQLSIFAEGQKNERKQEEATVSKSNRKKVDCFKKTQELKKTYENKYRDLEELRGHVNQAKMAGSPTERNADYMHYRQKLETKEQKCKSEMQRADQAYQNSVKALDESRIQWEKDMEQLCNKFDQLEMDRFNYLQNEMWVHVNLVSAVCVRDDEHCESVRKAIEQCDVDNDLTLFINDKGTGKERPAAVQYKMYQGISHIDENHARSVPPTSAHPGPPLPERPNQH